MRKSVGCVGAEQDSGANEGISNKANAGRSLGVADVCSMAILALVGGLSRG